MPDIAELTLLLPYLFSNEPSKKEALLTVKSKIEKLVLELDITQMALTPESINELQFFLGNFEVMFTGQLEPQQFVEMLNAYSPAGLSIRAGNEEKPGFKSFDNVVTLLELLEVDDTAL